MSSDLVEKKYQAYSENEVITEWSTSAHNRPAAAALFEFPTPIDASHHGDNT